jgi:hypothetical protein
MINTAMRPYNYSTLGKEDAYGQATNSGEVVGTIKMAISISSQAVQDNINFTDCNYIGLTMAELDNSYVIHYGNEKLKVLYVNNQGRFKQAYLQKI